MSEQIIPNVVVSMPSQLFTLARKFQAASNGKIFIGKIDTDPTIPENQIQVYLENEDGTTVPVSQPLIINQAGYPVYNGQIAKFVTVQGHSMAVYDSYGAQQFYYPNVLKYDPDQFEQRLFNQGGASLVGVDGGGTVQDFIDSASDDIDIIKRASSQNNELNNAIYSLHGAGKSLGAENTIFTASLLASKYKVIDIDISVSRDGVPFLMHDQDLSHITNGSGLNFDRDWDYIKGLKRKEFIGTPYDGLGVSSLDDFFVFCASRNLLITAELKNTTIESLPNILSLIKERKMDGKINLQCLNIDRLKNWRDIDEDVQLLTLVYDGMPNEDLDYVISETILLGNSGINVDINYSKIAELIDKAKEKRVLVNFWTAKQYTDEVSVLSKFPGHQISTDYMVV